MHAMDITLQTNPSVFACFAAIRHAVFINKQSSSFDSPFSVQDGEDKAFDTIHLPKMVCIGLRCVYDLLEADCSTSGEHCKRALQGLFDTLQYLEPEVLQGEDKNSIGPLFTTLLNLARKSSVDENVKSLAISCATSLAIAWGSTARLLELIKILLLRDDSETTRVTVPEILRALQSSAYQRLQPANFEWVSNGIPKSLFCERFSLTIDEGLHSGSIKNYSLAVKEDYVYVSVNSSIFKIGTGLGCSVRNAVKASKTNLPRGKILATKDFIVYLIHEKEYPELLVLNPDDLTTISSCNIPSEFFHGSVFPDENNLKVISPGYDDSFLLHSYQLSEEGICLGDEKYLNLSRKIVYACTGLVQDKSSGEARETRKIYDGSGEEIKGVFAGKDFKILLTGSGKAFFTGKAASLGLHHLPTSLGPQNELSSWTSFPCENLDQISIGHEGSHVLALVENGTVYFAGISKRGEDGQPGKRRNSKASKLKKFHLEDGQPIQYVATNSGSSALITRHGDLYLFGKDASFADELTGRVGTVRDIVQVALGKAHGVCLNSHGEVFTFGINNKGQCGRDNLPFSKHILPSIQEVDISHDAMQDEEVESDENCGQAGMCYRGSHVWHYDDCIVCSFCRECTGFGRNCISRARPGRSAGQPCGCGGGDAGCARCGCCRTCAGEDQLAGNLLGGNNVGGAAFGVVFSSSKGNSQNLTRKVDMANVLMEDNRGNDIGEKELNKKDMTAKVEPNSCLSISQPGKVVLGGAHVIQVACGLHHSLVLTKEGEVFGWGHNNHGQLGLGDTTTRYTPTKLIIPTTLKVVQVACGSNHSLLLLHDGSVLSFGNDQKGQLGRHLSTKISHLVPGVVPLFGRDCGRRATWIGASGDETFIVAEESLVHDLNLKDSATFATEDSYMFLPADHKFIIGIQKADGKGHLIKPDEVTPQVLLSDCSIAYNSQYDILFSLDKEFFLSAYLPCFNGLSADLKRISQSYSMRHLIAPKKPVICHKSIAITLLSYLDILSYTSRMSASEQQKKKSNKVDGSFVKEELSTVSRFEGFGGGWGYSAHSIEALRFMVDNDILVGGFGLFGGRGEYVARIKLYDVGSDVSEEPEGDILGETSEVPYDCDARQSCGIFFEKPVLVISGRWYVAWARVSGPSSDCGANGQSVVTGDDGTVFHFKSSKKSNNGTDVNAGQISSILYRVAPVEYNESENHSQQRPIKLLSVKFAMGVTPSCFDYLLDILQTFLDKLNETQIHNDGKERFLDIYSKQYVIQASFRLLEAFLLKLYPGFDKIKEMEIGESLEMIERVMRVKAVVSNALSHPDDDIPCEILEEAESVFVACFHIFYPSEKFQWLSLCHVLTQMEKLRCTKPENVDRLLCAIQLALSQIRLRNLLPPYSEMLYDFELTPRETSSQRWSLIDSTPDKTLVTPSDISGPSEFETCGFYPLLVKTMTKRLAVEEIYGHTLSFKTVIEKLLVILTKSMEETLIGGSLTFNPNLCDRICAFLSQVITEITAAALNFEEDGSGIRQMYTTPSRFSKVSSSKGWTTGNKCADAISFEVDRQGVCLLGIGLYGGSKVFDYELEVCESLSTNKEGLLKTTGWKTLHHASGSYSSADCTSDLFMVRLSRSVLLKAGQKYAILLRNSGGKTSSGDMGSSGIRGPDGTTFTFSACSLSLNGTNVLRGQLPCLLYSSTSQDISLTHSNYASQQRMAKKCLILTSNLILYNIHGLLKFVRSFNCCPSALNYLSRSPPVSRLLPNLCAKLESCLQSDPKMCVDVLTLIQDILPDCVALNNAIFSATRESEQNTPLLHQQLQFADTTTTSKFYTVVESEHPYKPVSVSSYRVSFPESVSWIALEFDPRSSTCQAEDCLSIYLCNRSLEASKSIQEEELRIIGKFSGNVDWPKQSILVPGNEVMFSLETASEYIKCQRSTVAWGFRCVCVGYECCISENVSTPPFSDTYLLGLKTLEQELAYLGGKAAATLVTENHFSSPQEEKTEDMPTVDEYTARLYNHHISLLGRGFALERGPSIHQVLDGVLPFSFESKEQQFLRDFIKATATTSGGRLARWLSPEPVIDPSKCQMMLPTEGTLRHQFRAGWPSTFIIRICDQYGHAAYSKDLHVKVQATPIENPADGPSMETGANDLPEIPFEPVLRDKMRYHSISMIKEFEGYSFEELRWMSPCTRRPPESMLVRFNSDNTCIACWTPNFSGQYKVVLSIDDIKLEQTCNVVVRPAPPDIVTSQSGIPKKPSSTPKKMRRYVGKHSAGLRIRIQPSLQSEQLGIIPPNGTIAFVEELENEDGVWLRLAPESILSWCNTPHGEGWCLQFHKPYERRLLFPMDDLKKTGESNEENSQWFSLYRVIRCGASGHNIRSQPTVTSPAIGILSMGNAVLAYNELSFTSEGIWAMLLPRSARKYCFAALSDEDQAWSLVAAKGYPNQLYLEKEKDVVLQSEEAYLYSLHCTGKFQQPIALDQRDLDTLQPTVRNRRQSGSSESYARMSPLTSGPDGRKDNQRLRQSRQNNVWQSPRRTRSRETPKTSLEDFIRGSFQSSTPESPIIISPEESLPEQSSSDVRSGVNSTSSSPGRFSVLQKWLKRENSKEIQDNNQASVASGNPDINRVSVKDIVRAIGESSSNGNGSVSPRRSPLPLRSGIRSPSPKPSAVVQPIVSLKDARSRSTSPSTLRTTYRTSGSRILTTSVSAVERNHPSAHNQRMPTRSKVQTQETTENARLAMRPSLAESIRSVYAAFLWHEGIVHDAMTCASYLKFHPTLPKEGEVVMRRPKRSGTEDKKRLRHSVEVSSSQYLHVKLLEGNLSAVSSKSSLSEDSSTSNNDNLTSSLPTTLKLIVILWDDISRKTLKLIEEQTLLLNQLIKKTKEKNDKSEKKKKKSRKEDKSEKANDDTCDLCGLAFPHSLTNHMKEHHPGCKKQSVGYGYNSKGTYCFGWSGDCGDGGVEASPWYILCEECRESYLKSATSGLKKEKRRWKRRSTTNSNLVSPSSVDIQQTLKNNSLFLLNIASRYFDSGKFKDIPVIRKRKIGIQSSNLAVVTEKKRSFTTQSRNPTPDSSTDSRSFPSVLFQCFSLLNSYDSQNGQLELPKLRTPDSSISDNDQNTFSPSHSRPFTRSRSLMGTVPSFMDIVGESDGQQLRRRNFSSSSIAREDSAMSVLCSPSTNLQRLFPQENGSMGESMFLPVPVSDPMSRPVMMFLIQNIDLDSVYNSMQRSVVKSVCKAYGMKALTWLLRSVSQTICLHDILWWTTSALVGKDSKSSDVGEHPCADVVVSGELCQNVLSSFHLLLQTISDLMPYLPYGSPLLQQAVKCWAVHFRNSDHQFLHRSLVFSSISKILSRSDEDCDADSYSPMTRSIGPVECYFYREITQMYDIFVSSRQAMLSSLLDLTTETFWESAEEERNKSKFISFKARENPVPTAVSVYVDNPRDSANKVKVITLRVGATEDELGLLRSINIDHKFCGWTTIQIPGRLKPSILRIELRGADATLRVRQVKVVGHSEGELPALPTLSPASLQIYNCEQETLRVFRLLTSQVFGGLLFEVKSKDQPLMFSQEEGTSEGDEAGDETNDLKEHVVGILFSNSTNLSSLQKQVCAQIFQGIRVECQRLRDDWDFQVELFQSGAGWDGRVSDTYCFELLSQVLALSGSSVGRAHLSRQGDLLCDLFVLLHIGTARIQRQVLALLRRVIPEIDPRSLSILLKNTVCSSKEGYKEGNDLTSPEMVAFDLMFSCIAKALTVQVRSRRPSGSKTTHTPSINFIERAGDQWYLKGAIDHQIALSIVLLVRDMAKGSLSNEWATSSRAAIASSILSVTSLADSSTDSSQCMKSSTLWLCLAALATLSDDFVDDIASVKVGSQQAIPSRPLCNNHDDGITPGTNICMECGPLCSDCDRVLHLNKRAKSHSRQVCKEEEDSIRVDYHEGCGRIKLYWLLALTDASTLHSHVEFRTQTTDGLNQLAAQNHMSCGFCSSVVNLRTENGITYCTEAECQENFSFSCLKTLPCGHHCGGVRDEAVCLPCLKGCSPPSVVRQDAEDMCMICFTESLGAAPAIQLACRHVYHFTCIRKNLEKRWPGARITFSFANCPICKAQIENDMLSDLLVPIQSLYQEVSRKALMRLEYDGLQNCDMITSVGSRYHGNPVQYALEKYAYYVCSKCGKAYFGGEARCEAEAGINNDFDPNDLICGGCSDVARAQICPRHGSDYLAYKCRYCCSVAIFFCFGTTHFCGLCHDDFRRITETPKGSLPNCPAGPKGVQLEGDNCPLGVEHPPTGEEFALGCGVCRNAHTF